MRNAGETAADERQSTGKKPEVEEEEAEEEETRGKESDTLGVSKILSARAPGNSKHSFQMYVCVCASLPLLQRENRGT